MKILVKYNDLSGLPRAWAIGKPEEIEAIRESAKNHAYLYIEQHRDNPLDLENPEETEVED